MEKHQAVAEIVWKDPESIQRRARLPQAIYAANIRFIGIDGFWSVILMIEDLITQKQDPSQSTIIRIGFLFPEKVKPLLKRDLEFTITEGPLTIIASGKILSIVD